MIKSGMPSICITVLFSAIVHYQLTTFIQDKTRHLPRSSEEL